MWRQLMHKWFGLTDPPCESCEILRDQLDKSETERRELLHRLLEKPSAEPSPPISLEELKPITPQFVPWRVRQQMLEQEDRERARLMREKQKEIKEVNDARINSLEQELGVDNAGSLS